MNEAEEFIRPTCKDLREDVLLLYATLRYLSEDTILSIYPVVWLVQ
jgi:hypothetical protein